jgi:glycerophosphoryl diester phosphodiesterase
MEQRILTIAHRGNSSRAPENTLAAFEQAAAMGADGVEMDLRLSADGHIVLIHDENTERTTGKFGQVSNLTLKELRKLDAGSWKDSSYAGQKIPLFEEACRLLAGRCRIFAELKIGPLGAKIAAIARATGVIDQLNLLCWGKQPQSVREARAALPEVAILELGQAPENIEMVGPDYFQERLAAGYSALDYEKSSLTPDFCHKASRGEMPVYCWTVNKREDMLKMADMNIAGITTDHPAQLMKIIG